MDFEILSAPFDAHHITREFIPQIEMIKDGVLELQLLSGKIQTVSAEQRLLSMNCTEIMSLKTD